VILKEALHVAIIMDGNGRWAQRRGLPRVAGHRAGIASVRRAVEHALDAGIARLTLYAFSSDNWRRPPAEVQSIFWLMRAFLRLEARRLAQRGVRLQTIGRRDRLALPVLREIEKAESISASGSRLDLCVAIDYSARDAIARAAMTMAGAQSETVPTASESVRPQLTHALGPDVDLLIRTGGEQRLSDFLLWESAYAELYFTDRMWPDFNQADLAAALAEFHRRDRRFGAVPEKPTVASASPLPMSRNDLVNIHDPL
jgi:undecaprenyl diphosphate synthase